MPSPSFWLSVENFCTRSASSPSGSRSSEPICGLAELADAARDAVLGRSERREPCAHLGARLAQRHKRLRRLLDLVAARIALPEKLGEVFQPDFEGSAVVAAGNFSERALDIAMTAVEFGKQLLDRMPRIEDRCETVLERLLLGANGGDASVEIGNSVAALLNFAQIVPPR
jgi:hypothetical protein